MQDLNPKRHEKDVPGFRDAMRAQRDERACNRAAVERARRSNANARGARRGARLDGMARV